MIEIILIMTMIIIINLLNSKDRKRNCLVGIV